MDQNRYATHSDESFKGNKWISGGQDAQQNFFNKYNNQNRKSVNQYTVQSGVESNNRYHTEFSQITNMVDTGFKKIKYNQMETLNELRQEYQILRNLPIQEQVVHEGYVKNDTESSVRQSVVSSKKSKRPRRSQKQLQILSIQKKQLEMVIGNSMRKIEELLNNQVQYKKIIHQLQLQADNKGNDDRLDILTKNMKKSEAQLNQRIENLKKQIQRLKESNRLIQDRANSLETEISVKEQEIRRFREDRRKLEDQVRSEKDKYLQLEIQNKRLKMEYELLDKDKSGEINRIYKNIDEQKNENQINIYKIKTLQDQLRTKQSIIETLKQEIERLRHKPAEKFKPAPPTPSPQRKSNVTDDHISLFHNLIGHLREESVNQNKASLDLLSSVLHNVESKKNIRPPPQNNTENDGLLNELQNIRDELSRLKRNKEDDKRVVDYVDNSEYIAKINMLQNDLADNQIENQRGKEDYQNLKTSYDQMQTDLDTLHKECLELRNKMGSTEKSSFFSFEDLRNKFRQKELGYEEQIRNLKSKLDQALFTSDKWKKDKDHSIGLLRVQNQSGIKLCREQIVKLERDKAELTSQLEKMKAFYEAKLREKSQVLRRMSQQSVVMVETHEKSLSLFKNNNEQQINGLLRKLHEMADLQDRYSRLASQSTMYQREVHELRHLIRKFKGLNDNVDHLWMVKETEYGNISVILNSIRT